MNLTNSSFHSIQFKNRFSKFKSAFVHLWLSLAEVHCPSKVCSRENRSAANFCG